MSTKAKPGLDRIKNIIAIGSGKGGVGKSTVAVNLAVALQRSGAAVGLLDADIYGPSQVGMLGSQGATADVGDNVLYPTRKHNLSFMSMGLLTGDDAPVIWRAPMAMKMIHQFLGSVVWGELDYLLIDLPPGTGDVQLTLAQQAQLTGAIIVTTPQDVALSVAMKGLRMFQQVEVPIIGIVENMSGFVCGHCGETTAIFNKGGGRLMADQIDVPFLGALPLDPEIMSSGEMGVPILEGSSDSVSAQAILELTANFKSELKRVTAAAADRPTKFECDATGRLVLQWPNGKTDRIEAHDLRLSCPCAQCVDEDSGQRMLDPKAISLDIKAGEAQAVGNYALAVNFSDGHNTGIYSWDYLRQVAEAASSQDRKSFSI